MKITAYTYAYYPFSMGGGNRLIPVKSELEAQSLHELGKGYKGYLINSPNNGKTFIAESETGAIIGNSIDSVKRDIENAEPEVMAKQIEEAKQEVKRAKYVSEDEWWRLLRLKKE